MNRIARTILIVDDSAEDRELYRRYLLRDREYSYTILEASLGQQGLDLWHQHQPDVLLLDYRLPDLDGLEFLSQLQPTTQEFCLPIILMTGQGNEAIAVQSMKAGAQDYLVKGQITPEGLQQAVNGAIEAVQLRTQLQQRIERELLVSQIIQKVQQTLELEEILATIVAEIRQFLHTDRVLVFQLEPDGNGTVVAESVGAQWRSLLSSTIYDPCLANNYLRFSRPESLNHDVAFAEDYVKRYCQGQVTAISDIDNSDIDPCHVELLAQFQVKANLVVPILHGDRFWGLLIAHHCAAPRSWQPLEIDLLKELVAPVSIALRQAQLYQQVQRDLVERQQIEAELRESEEHLRVALEASRMGTWDWNLQTGQIFWSDNLEALFGLETGEFDGSYPMFVSVVHPDDRERMQLSINHAISTGADYNIEFRVVYPNGYIRWALSQGKVFYDPNGQPMRMAGVDIDITERKRSEEALQESEERFRQLAENIDAVFWIRNISENWLCYVSPAYERLWGLNPHELYEDQRAWVNYIHPDDREVTANTFQEKAMTGQFDQEYRIVLADGSIRWVRDRCFPLADETGKIYRLVGIAEDITDRKQVEDTLRQSEEFKNRLLESSPDCIKVLDTDGRLLYMNVGGMCLLEIDDFMPHLNTEWICFWQGEYRQQAEQALAAAKAGEVSIFRGFCPTAKGRPKWWEVIVSPIQNASGQTEQVLSISRDITERQQAEMERERLLEQEQAARAEAERANRLKDEFLAILSHELRSPLNPILGWTKLLQTRKFDETRTAEALATIERNAKLQTQLIDDLLDVAKILRGKLSMDTVPVDLVFVIESAMDTVRAAAVAKSILLHPVLPQIGRVSGDSARLQQVVWNLLSNAIKFTPHNGRVDIWLERIGNEAQITVSDTGKGISADFLPHLFESFQQEDASTTRKYGGLGLGLAIVRTLVEAHGGTITADSLGEGQGATFTVRFPLLDTELETIPSDELPLLDLDLTGIRVLAVDDEPDARELLTIVLTQYGAEVLTVTSAAEALTALESFQPDALVSDIGMPEMDGYTLMRQIRALAPEKAGQIPAIALTAYAREDDRQRAIASGYQRQVTKPLDPEQLVSALMAIARQQSLA
ncbi:PAS domain-containing protein [Merismopedia glauca]|uniref:histidine kinase n=1 Tax=Merismopedia glauca CCAP 1448/3 TaxID=1296344 RepID=A0A2T1CAF9_9CYAN|nr:PAS domain-containing protein [Merismopedia glauca]PSB05127.1 histidine kinase [Merismopedia glauca CCAP 1448/3]